MEGNPAESRSSESQSFWLPAGLQLGDLPPALRQVVSEVLTPAYEELVLRTPTALERTSGLSYMHLIWLEVVEQYHLAKVLFPKKQQQTTRKGTKGHARYKSCSPAGERFPSPTFVLLASQQHRPGPTKRADRGPLPQAKPSSSPSCRRLFVPKGVHRCSRPCRARISTKNFSRCAHRLPSLGSGIAIRSTPTSAPVRLRTL